MRARCALARFISNSTLSHRTSSGPPSPPRPRLEGPVAIGQQEPPVELLHGERETLPAQRQVATTQVHHGVGALQRTTGSSNEWLEQEHRGRAGPRWLVSEHELPAAMLDSDAVALNIGRRASDQRELVEHAEPLGAPSLAGSSPSSAAALPPEGSGSRSRGRRCADAR